MSKEKTSTMMMNSNTSSSLRRWRMFATMLVSCAALFAAAASAASAAPDVYSVTTISPSNWVTGDDGRVLVELNNSGDTATTEFSAPLLTVTVDLPPNVTSIGLTPTWIMNFNWECNGTSTVTCTTPNSLPAFAGNLGIFSNGPASLMLSVETASGPGVTGTFPLTTTISNGGMASPSVETQQVAIANTPPSFGAHGVSAGAFDESGNDFTQAGGHPTDVRNDFALNIDEMATFNEVPIPSGSQVKDVMVNTPPGFLGDPSATPKCTQADMAQGSIGSIEGVGCPPSTQVGKVLIRTTIIGNFEVAVYNLVPPGDQPAQFAFWTPVGIQRVNPTVRADGDYGLSILAPRITQADVLLRSTLVLWGNPSDPSHDVERCAGLNIPSSSCNGVNNQGFPYPDIKPHPYEGPEKAFLTLPTNCVEDQVTDFHLDKWNDPAPEDGPLTDPRWTHLSLETPRITGCDKLPFDPTMDLKPTSGTSDSATGLDAHLHFPRQNDSDPDGLVQAHLKKTTVRFPEGLALNAAAADGLQGCSLSQIGLTSKPGALPITFNNQEPNCPDAAKIGSGEVITPLLENALHGEVFLAAQNENPFNSTYAVYIVVREPSILVKLAGKVEPDPVTGQITATFDQNPQLPFEDLNLSFYGGKRAAMVTPSTCGTFTSHTEMVPWSAADPNNPTPTEIVDDPSSFTVDKAPSGGCVSSKAQLPFSLGFDAGTAAPVAGAHSPFEMRITRPDGNQEIDRLELQTPEGFSATLKGVPYCSEAQIAAAKARSGKAEQASPSCPAASQIGTTQVGAGAGDPYYVGGKLYLAGPYKGTKLSLVAVVPAVAGPFDLGVQVVRVALQVNPRTAQITAVTDPIPQVLEGVPLRIRDIRVNVDRPGFALNPTDCTEQQVKAKVLGTGGATSNLQSRFQVGGCQNLGFKPGLSIQLKGGTRRGSHPGLKAVLTARPGDANIAAASVTLPSSAFLDQAHIRTICTRVQFAADQCPKGAIYGYAKGTSPLIDGTIEGPVYLRSSDNKLPDLVADLGGQVDIELVGRIDSVHGGIRNTFDLVPDAPVDRFTITMQGGKKGLVVNSRNLCASTNRADARFTAQNGKVRNFRPVVKADCGKGRKPRARKRIR